MATNTDDYYSRNAVNFAKDTVGLDVRGLYERFLKHVPSDGTVLDAGCGSGRDAKNFADRGLDVVAFDSSPEMVQIAIEHSGLPVKLARFEDLDFQARFDGIWACASLLHLPSRVLSDVLDRLRRALKPRGVLYCSFKYGVFEGMRDGRYFTDMDEARLEKMAAVASGFIIEEIWVTADIRCGREHEKWLNALLSIPDV